MRKKILALNYLLKNALILRLRRKATNRRRYWVHPINERRKERSEFLLFGELLDDPERFKQYLRMCKEDFFFLLGLLKDGYNFKTVIFRIYFFADWKSYQRGRIFYVQMKD